MAVLPPDPVFNLRNNDMGQVNCICFHQSERLFCGTAKGAVYLWDLQTNRSPLHFTVDTEPINSIFHLDETLLTQSKGGVIKSWSLSNSGYEQTSLIDTNHLGFCRMEVIADENLLISPKDENSIHLYDSDDLMCLHQSLVPVGGASGGDGGSGASLATIVKGSAQKLGQLMCFKFIILSGQYYILACYESGDFLTWDLRCSKVINSQKLEECPMAVDYDMITNRGIYGGPSDKLGVFSYNTKITELSKKSEIALKNPGINCIQIRKDQKVFSTGGWDGRVRIFSWKSLRPLAVLTEHKSAVVDICYSDDPVQLWKARIMAAAGLDGQISLWDLYN